MYMGYCRFEGTNAELRACLGVVEEHVYEEAEYEVSDHEICQFKDMVNIFYGWMCDMALIDDNGELDKDELGRMCEAMAKSYPEEEQQ